MAGMEALLCLTMAKLLIFYREACTCVYNLCKGGGGGGGGVILL